MSISDIVEQTKEDILVKKEVCDSYDKTINEKGVNVDTYLSLRDNFFSKNFDTVKINKISNEKSLG